MEHEHKSVAPAARCCLKCVDRKGPGRHQCSIPESAKGHHPHPPSAWAEVTPSGPSSWWKGKSSLLLLTLICALKITNKFLRGEGGMIQGTGCNIWYYLQCFYSLSEWACTQLLPQLVQKYLGRTFIISDLRYVHYQSYFFSKKL